MKTRLLIIIGIVIIGVIVTSTVGTMQYQSVYNQNCSSDDGYVVGFLKCMYINEDFSESASQDIIDARDNLKELYRINPSLGTFHLKDAVSGYGIGDGFLVVYIVDEYYNDKEIRNLIKNTVVDITDDKVDIEFMTERAGEPIPILEGYEFCVENEKECYFVECADNEIYHRGICMTPETKKRSESIGEVEPEEQVWSGAEGMCAEGYPDCEDYVGSIVEPGFKNEEPFTKIEIMFGEPLNDKLVPVIFTEVTTHAETLDEIMVWNFELIGHSGDDRRVVWDTLPKDKRIWYVINDDGQDILIPANIAVPADQHLYEMDCGFFQTVEGESAHPTLLQIKNNTSVIYAQNSRIGIYPDSNEEYSFEFASIFRNYVQFPEDAVEIISQETKECKLTQNVEDDLTGKYTDGYYTKMTFRFN